MKVKFTLTALLYSVIISFCANSFVFIKQAPQSLFLLVPIFIFANIFAGIFTIKTSDKKLKMCHHGTVMLASYYSSLIVSVVFHILLAVNTVPENYTVFIWSLVVCLCVNLIVFWNGLISVYFTFTQLGIKLRALYIIFGMIPIANLVVLFFLIKTTLAECIFEANKEHIDLERHDNALCATKYPILLIHGLFFRDLRFLNYWGRIPKALEANGATIFYGNQTSAASVANSAAEIKTRIENILEETGAEKINIIAHSKGGLDCRYAVARLGIADKVASLTTINTPHRGCLFADYLLTKLSSGFKNRIAKAYNRALNKLGEPDVDFLAGLSALTAANCKKLDSELSIPQTVFCQSVGSVLPKAKDGSFPLNLSYRFVKHFDGENDGLVSIDSFKWGENYIFLNPDKDRGISHGDMIDLNRENIDGFDVREFYVRLVNGLKNRGL